MLRAAFISTLIFLVSFAAPMAGAQTAPQKISVSMSSTDMPSIQLYIARERSFFREEGFDPQLIRMSANAAIAAGVAGELDALGSVGSAVRGNSIQVAGLTPPYVFLARDKFKMNVLESSIDKFASIQQGIGVQTKFVQESPEWLRRLLRVKAKSARFFHDNEKETAEILARMWKVDLATASEWYRRCKPAFTPTGIPTDDEIKEFLADEVLALKLTESVPAAKIFDFSLQRMVNRELGIKG